MNFLHLLLTVLITNASVNNISLQVNSSDGLRINDTSGFMSRRITKNVRTEDMCDTCVYVIDQLKEIIEDPESRVEFKLMLLETCEWCPSSYGQRSCKMLVEHYFDQLVEFILNKDSREVCEEIYFCDSDKLSRECKLESDNPKIQRFLNTVCR